MVDALTQVSDHTFHFQEPVRKELEPVQRDMKSKHWKKQICQQFKASSNGLSFASSYYT